MLVKIEARILIFQGTDFHFPSTSVPPGTFFRLWLLVHTSRRLEYRQRIDVAIGRRFQSVGRGLLCTKQTELALAQIPVEQPQISFMTDDLTDPRRTY